MTWRTSPERVILPGLGVGIAALVVLMLGLIFSTTAAVRAWLVADLFVLGLSLGALVILMVQGIVGGTWSETLRPALLAMAGALPVPVAGMIVPLLGMSAIFSWVGAPPAALPERVANKLLYLDPLFLAGRTIVEAAIWIGVAILIGTWGTQLPREQRVPRCIAGLIFYAITTMFFSTDWMLALDPTFYSTIYGVLEASGEIVGAFALAVLILYATGVFYARSESTRGVLVAEDLANLLFGFTLLWVYLAFMQWLIVWSGDLPEEIHWYLERSDGAWFTLLVFLIAFHFAIPVAGFLSRSLKRSPEGLAGLAGAVFFGHLIDVVWRTAPAFGDADLVSGLFIVAALIAIGGVWLGGVCWLAGGRPLPERWRRADA